MVRNDGENSLNAPNLSQMLPNCPKISHNSELYNFFSCQLPQSKTILEMLHGLKGWAYSREARSCHTNPKFLPSPHFLPHPNSSTPGPQTTRHTPQIDPFSPSCFDMATGLFTTLLKIWIQLAITGRKLSVTGEGRSNV